MESDRELLEMAAKAAGLQVEWVRNPAYIQERWEAHIPCGWVGQPSMREWNPLREPGDAFELAVKLRIVIKWWQDCVIAWLAWDKHCTLPIGDNAAAATRRAIVRAAAEIGRDAKEEEKK